MSHLCLLVSDHVVVLFARSLHAVVPCVRRLAPPWPVMTRTAVRQPVPPKLVSSARGGAARPPSRTPSVALSARRDADRYCSDTQVRSPRARCSVCRSTARSESRIRNHEEDACPTNVARPISARGDAYVVVGLVLSRTLRMRLCSTRCVVITWPVSRLVARCRRA